MYKTALSIAFALLASTTSAAPVNMLDFSEHPTGDQAAIVQKPGVQPLSEATLRNAAIVADACTYRANQLYAARLSHAWSMTFNACVSSSSDILPPGTIIIAMPK